MAAGHGGQILVSEAARALAAVERDPEISLRDLGVHSLRDMPAPERVYSVVAPDLQAEFPPPGPPQRPLGRICRRR